MKRITCFSVQDTPIHSVPYMRRMIYLMIHLFFVTPSWSSSHHPASFLKQIIGSKTEGAQIVQHYCGMCHAPDPMIPVGAPPKGDALAWAPRVKQGMDILFQHTDEGLNAMPARGGCFECTDKQLMLAILALLPQEKDRK